MSSDTFLGPLTRVLALAEATKNNCMHARLGQLGTIRYKKATSQLPFLRCWVQKQHTTHDPCSQHH